jgi:hypothetical protein
MPLVSDLLCDRLLPCLLSVTCNVTEVTAMPVVSDLLCDRDYCNVSCQ